MCRTTRFECPNVGITPPPSYAKCLCVSRLFVVSILIICLATRVVAQDEQIVRTKDPVLFEEYSVTPGGSFTYRNPDRIRSVDGSNAAEPAGVYVKTTRAGELAALLGDRVNLIDTLHVEGPINGEDFNIIWQSSFYGHLKVIDLGKASIEDGIIPDYALFHIDVQVDWDTLIIDTIWLEKLILPYNTEEIGRSAFAYATSLIEIQFPESLKKIGTSSFTDCIRLATDPFVLPPNLEFLGYQAFYQCRSLAGEVILPPTMQVIDGAAFYRTQITKINIPDKVEYLGDFAFYGTNLKEIDLPDDCWLDTRGAQFYANYELERVHLPENCRQIPDDIFLYCTNLKEVNLPDCTTHIRTHAFGQCTSLACFSSLVLPDGLLALGDRALLEVPIREIVLPSTLSYIGAEMFGYGSKIERIYCKADQVPECHDWELRPGESPFYGVRKDIEVYIPTGTKDDYASSFGWDYFTNFIETDSFPSLGIGDVRADSIQDAATYDLYGRKITQPVSGNIYISGGRKFICR